MTACVPDPFVLSMSQRGQATMLYGCGSGSACTSGENMFGPTFVLINEFMIHNKPLTRTHKKPKLSSPAGSVDVFFASLH